MSGANDPAFPQYDHLDGWSERISGGMTKREYFAALAMQGALAGGQNVRVGNASIFPTLARVCVNFADALLAELAKEESK